MDTRNINVVDWFVLEIRVSVQHSNTHRRNEFHRVKVTRYRKKPTHRDERRDSPDENVQFRWHMPFVYDGHQKWWHRLHFQRKTQQHYSTTVSNWCKCVYCEWLRCECFEIQFAFCLQITTTDQLSKEICNACYESVTKFYFHYEIVKTAQKNQHQFLKMQLTMVMFDQVAISQPN